VEQDSLSRNKTMAVQGLLGRIPDGGRVVSGHVPVRPGEAILSAAQAAHRQCPTSAAICAGGLALIILPTLIVGNELLILAGVAAAVGLWFFAYRHGQLRGLVNAKKETS
jgi:hypothetical protein